MPRKVRELVRDLVRAGFQEVPRRGRGSHRVFVHDRYAGGVTVSGHDGDDAKPYQERQVRQALEDSQT
jgi:predicted RNA binding protein YcfA (HicA-like mRNA interferase family)